MAPSLPTPLRVVAGLIGSALDLVRNFPQELPALGVDLAGRALRVSLRVRQEMATLAVRGDDLLSAFGKTPEKPAWATFDDEPAATTPSDTATEPPRSSSPRPAPASSRPTPSAPPRPAGAAAEAASSTKATGPRPATPRSATPRSATPRATTPRATTPRSATPRAATGRAATPRPAGRPATTAASGAPATPAPTVDALTLSTVALRERLADLDQAAVQALLLREESGQARAAYLTLLGNRLTTLRAGSSA